MTAGQPGRAVDDAREVHRKAQAEHDLESASVAQRALGLASKELGLLADAEAHHRAAVEVARVCGLELREGEARMSLSIVLALGGRTDEALREADIAAGLLVGCDAARLQVQRAAILQRLGRNEQALQSYDFALAVFTRLADGMEVAQVRANRGILHAYRGNFTAAEADLGTAKEMYVDLGLEMAAAEVHHNLGFLAARRGDVPVALACYDAAAEVFRRLDVSRPAALLDRCEALLAVRLIGEARLLAQRAVSQLKSAGLHVDLAEAQLVLAQTELIEGDHRGALETAGLAWRSFMQQDRAGWAALAHYAMLRARWQRDGLSTGSHLEATRTANELEAAGWAVPAADARLIAARAALMRGLVAEAGALLEATRAARRSGPAELRARAWHAEALLRLARGQERSGLAALRVGLVVLDQHQATLGATELRVHAKSHAVELATLGLRIAVERQGPESVLAWAERWRAGLYRMARVRPPEDPGVAGKLAELRRVVTELQGTAASGKDTSGLLRRQAGLEMEIRRESRHLSGSASAPLSRPAAASVLANELGERALLELVELDDAIHAVTLVEGRARLRQLARASEVADEVEQLRFALGRLVSGRTRPSSIEACTMALRYASHRLDALLLLPLPELTERGTVIVPTGVLHRLPWAMLPSCRTRSVAVAPSATQWLLASRRSGSVSGGGSLLVAGPGCDSGVQEVADLVPHVRRPEALCSDDATVAQVTRGLARAEMAHVVAHGTFRRDNPLFSSLQLADGPLTIYDLELLHKVPPLMVLSACDGGVSAVSAGDELMGLASALLALGARTVIASVNPIPDDLTRALMVKLHRHLEFGLAPATALEVARSEVESEVGSSDPRIYAMTGFTCFGAG